MQDSFRRQEILWTKLTNHSKLAEGREHAARIREGRTKEKINVAGEAWMPVKRHCVAAHDEEFNFVRVQ